jgi:hypothetical protein
VPGTASELTDGWASDVGLGFSSLGLVVGIVALVVGFFTGATQKVFGEHPLGSFSFKFGVSVISCGRYR